MLKNGFYNAISAVISIALSVLTIPLLIRLIGLQDYGLWTLVTATIGIVGLAEAGLSVSTTVFLSRDLSNNDYIGMSQTLTLTAGAMLVIATLVAAGLWWCAPILINLFPKLNEVQRTVAILAFQLGGVVVWARLMQQITIGVLQAKGRYGISNVVITIQGILLNLGLVIVAWQGGRIIAMMIWQLLVTVCSLLALDVIAWRSVSKHKLRLIFSLSRSRTIVRYSAMTWLVSVSGALFSQLDRVIVGATLGTTILGVYGAITSVTAKINSLSAAPVQPLLPELSALLAKPNVDQLKVEQRVQEAIRFNVVLAFCIGIVLVTLAPQIIQIMIPGTSSGANLLGFQIAILIYTLYSPNAVGFYVLLGQKVSTCLIIQMASAIFSLALIATGAGTFGLLGAIVGNAGYLGVWGLTYYGMKQLGISVQKWGMWLSIPMLWFVVMLMPFILFAPEQFLLRVFFSLLGISLLVLWWFQTQKKGLIFLFQHLLSR